MSNSVALLLCAQAVALVVLLTVALDQYAHKRVEQLGGVNIWAIAVQRCRRAGWTKPD